MTNDNQRQTQQSPPPLPTQPQVDWAGQPDQIQQPEFNPFLPAWEQAGSWLNAFLKTTGQVLFKPFLTFQQPAYPGSASLIAFALPWLVLATTVSMFYGTFAGKPVNFTLTALAANLLGNGLGFLLSLLILHLALKIVRADQNGFKATFRACIYMCCTYLWLLIPWLGSLLALIWCLAIIFSVLAASQQVSRMRILGALLVYITIIFCIFLVSIMIMGMAAITRIFNALMQDAQLPFPW